MDLEILENPNLNVPKPPKSTQRRKSRSDVWNHFEVKLDTYGTKTCVCKYCDHVYERVASKFGTGNLRRHLDSCPRKRCMDVGVMLSEGKSRFDPLHFRQLLCNAIVVHDLPFRFVEYEHIVACFQYIKRDINLMTRNTIKADVLRMYEKEKSVVKSRLSEIPGRVCLTSDCWSSITSDGYISLTCHFIDEDWVLQKLVLNFSLMPSPHGKALCNKLMCDWGIENKIFSLKLDNAAANDLSIDYLIKQMNLNNSLISKGEFFHIRCCAHIINLVVQVGLEGIEQSVTKIRDSVKFVRSSQTRKQNFLECVRKVGLETKRGLREDVITRWNSTFFMLDNALYYRKTFMNLELYDANYKFCPSSTEWDKIEQIRGFLSLFYDVSNLFSGSSYPTANLYFRPVVMCYNYLKQNINSPDEYIRKMVGQMMPKFEKYWSDFSMILTIAVVFDPRYKLQFVDFFYKKLYGASNSHQFLLVKQKLFVLFEEYCTCCIDNVDHARSGENVSCDFTNADSLAVVEEFNSLDVEFGLSQQKSQLELYMEEKRLDVKSNLDILNYWKTQQFKYPQVACMARDILSIPITTVASESVFSIGGRVLDPHRSSLKPDTVEAIICSRDWLFGKKAIKVDIPTNDLAEDFLNGDEETQTGSSTASTSTSTTFA